MSDANPHAERLAEAYADSIDEKAWDTVDVWSAAFHAFNAGHGAALRSPVIRAMAEALEHALTYAKARSCFHTGARGHREHDETKCARCVNVARLESALAQFAAMGGE